MKSTTRGDIKDKLTFKRIGYNYTQVLADNEKHVYLYKMSNPGVNYLQYELVRGKKYKNPDGSIVYTYPCDEDFGTYGWYICGSPEHVTKQVNKIWHSLTEHYPEFQP